MRTNKLIDETGNRHGRLVVIGRGERRRTTQMWVCRCDCGNMHQANGTNLRKGDVGSCGKCQYKCLPGDEPAFRQALNNYRKNAEKRGLAFELTAEEFRHVTQQTCRYCGAVPANSHKPARPRVGAEPYVYSGVDRLDNNVGYVNGNVASCCAICNAAKSKMSVSEFLRWVGRVARHSAAEINLLYKD